MRQPPEKSEHGRCCAACVEAEAGEDRGGARGRRMRADVGEPRLDLGDAMRIGARSRPRRAARCARVSAASTTSIRLSGPPGASCASRPMRARAGMSIAPCSSAELAGDGAEQRGLADAVAADQPDARAVRNARRGAIEQQAAGDADRDVVEHEHAAFL